MIFFIFKNFPKFGTNKCGTAKVQLCLCIKINHGKTLNSWKGKAVCDMLKAMKVNIRKLCYFLVKVKYSKLFWFVYWIWFALLSDIVIVLTFYLENCSFYSFYALIPFQIWYSLWMQSFWLATVSFVKKLIHQETKIAKQVVFLGSSQTAL